MAGVTIDTTRLPQDMEEAKKKIAALEQEMVQIKAALKKIQETLFPLK